ncbi:hypothetical protein [Desulfolutivibrio sulfoxidireducens]|uniref:phosphorylase family protein n=1 Tax=Desulfolutivibrio sulfoxidireducens TaxID=2773299 RepID=UPI00159E0732|nr:hypothetical protein [Desulfolutivibrio sulfoxidireducens]QLA20747.1 hypothetical protein GD604_14005 [Desulfolutivibrio sulfoxidireducens]
MDVTDYNYRKSVARELLSLGRTALDDVKYVDFDLLGLELKATSKFDIQFPGNLTPTPTSIDPKPEASASLPSVDVVVITWTIAEVDALSDILTPGYSHNTWYRYDRYFNTIYAPQIRKKAPAYNSRRLGSYFLTTIGKLKVLCFKSELHLNQDGIQDYQMSGQTSLPVRQMLRQIIEETKCKYIISTGTAGGISIEHGLGDVLVTRAARFRLAQEFKTAQFNHNTYYSKWCIPTTYFADAEKIMRSFAAKLNEPIFGPPTKKHIGSVWTLDKAYVPTIIHEGGQGPYRLPEKHPILTTDYFEFGNSQNAEELWDDGCGVEMGDAVLGLVCEQDVVNAPSWLVIRNLSDPQINGEITDSPSKLDMQVHWAVWYYETYGYWTSVMSSIVTWAVIAGI